MITHLVLIIIPTIVIAYFFYGQMYDTIVSETIRQEQNFSKHSSSTINAAMDQINVVSDSILDNAYLTDILNEKNSFRLLQLLRSAKTEDFYTFTNFVLFIKFIFWKFLKKTNCFFWFFFLFFFFFYFFFFIFFFF